MAQEACQNQKASHSSQPQMQIGGRLFEWLSLFREASMQRKIGGSSKASCHRSDRSSTGQLGSHAPIRFARGHRAALGLCRSWGTDMFGWFEGQGETEIHWDQSSSFTFSRVHQAVGTLSCVCVCLLFVAFFELFGNTGNNKNTQFKQVQQKMEHMHCRSPLFCSLSGAAFSNAQQGNESTLEPMTCPIRISVPGL